MIFTLILYLFVFTGVFIMIADYMFWYGAGIYILPMVAMGLKMTGFIMVFIGVVLYQGRAKKTFGSQFIPLPDPNKTICLHIGKSSGKIMTGQKFEPNRIRMKGRDGRWMNIKDTGKSINVAGHDFTVTAQENGSNLPFWVLDLVSKWKEKWNVRNEDEFKKLYNKIKGVESYLDVEKIPFLEPVMADPEKKRMILDLSLDEIRNMTELLYDGREIGVKEYLDWADEATPYDNEAIIDSTISQMRSQDQDLANMKMMDLMKWVMPIVVLMIMGAITYQIFLGSG